MKFIKKIYNFLVFVQVILLIVFIVENINGIDTIDYSLDVIGTNYSFSLSMYEILAMIAVYFVILLLVSVNIFSMGFNDEGTKNVGKYMGFLGMISILNVASGYYILMFGTIGAIVMLLIFVFYLFYFLDSLTHSKIETE